MNPDFVIPYSPRYPQRDIHEGIFKHRFSVIVAHRRMGKTVCVLNHLIRAAWLAQGGDGRFAYVAPYRNQAKAIAWDYIQRFAGVIPGAQFSESDIECRLPNGSRIRLYGADNPDALRGIYLDGVVLDEVADMRPNVWGEIIRPALSDRNGFAVFIGTPKGQNLFYDLYHGAIGAAGAGWYSALYRADETGVIAPEELDQAREAMSDAQYRQEFLCDFSAAVDNALITIDLVSKAARRQFLPHEITGAPKAIGVDVARYGDDRSAICKREGLLCHSVRPYAGLDNMIFAGIVAREIEAWRPDAVFVDAGRGEGVIDRLRQLGFTVHEINFGSQAIDSSRYANKRSEMWDGMREWLTQGGAIPNDSALKSDLSAPVYAQEYGGRRAYRHGRVEEAVGGLRRRGMMQEILVTLIQMIVVTIIPIAFARVNSYIAERIKCEKTERMLLEMSDAVETAVRFTSQTYTDALKKSGKPLGKAAREKAFEMAMNETQKMLSHEAVGYLNKEYGSPAAYLASHIEAAVKQQRCEG